MQKKIVELLNHIGITIDHFKEIHNNEEKEKYFHDIMEKVHGLLEHSHSLGLDHIGTDARHAVVEAYNAAVVNKNLKDTHDLEEAEKSFIKELVLELAELMGVKTEKVLALRNKQGCLKTLAAEFAHVVGVNKEQVLALKEKAKYVFIDLQHIVENKKGDKHLRENDINEHTRTKAIRRCVLIISEMIVIAKIAHYDFKHSHDQHAHGHNTHGHHDQHAHNHYSHSHHAHGHNTHGHHDQHAHGHHSHSHNTHDHHAHSHAEIFSKIVDGRHN